MTDLLPHNPDQKPLSDFSLSERRALWAAHVYGRVQQFDDETGWRDVVTGAPLYSDKIYRIAPSTQTSS